MTVYVLHNTLWLYVHKTLYVHKALYVPKVLVICAQGII